MDSQRAKNMLKPTKLVWKTESFYNPLLEMKLEI